jgi:deoxyribonuclease-4
MKIGVHLNSYQNIITFYKKYNLINVNDILYIQIMFNSSIIKEIKNLQKLSVNYIIHSSYSINLAKIWNKYSSHIHQLIYEIKLANRLKSKFIVVHVGKYMNLSKQVASNNMLSALLYVHKKTLKYKNIQILLETPAGQGTELFYKLQDFADFFKKLNTHPDINIKNRFGICIDTCHLFSSGYSINTQLITKINKLLNLDNIKLIHLNNSSNILGSKKDRHASIESGYIPTKDLKLFSKYYIENTDIPIILETPQKTIYEDFKVFQNSFNKLR